MRILVTGSAGHLGEALMRLLPGLGHEAVGLDILASPFTHVVAPVTDPGPLGEAMRGCDAVIHAATLHKPHVATHPMRDFVETNVTGTLTVLETALALGVGRVVFTSTTSAFGAALTPPEGAPAAWIDEDVAPVPKNIYGTTKVAAEDLCRLMHRRHGLPVVVLRTSRFFPEADDDPARRNAYPDANLKALEYAYRRVDIEDAALAHLLAAERAPGLGFGRFIVSAATPFRPGDLADLRRDPAAVFERRCPGTGAAFARLGWRMPGSIDRVYDSARAQAALGWRPVHGFASVLDQASRGDAIGSALAGAVGAKGYHAESFADGPYPVA